MITVQQASELLRMVALTRVDDLTCDGCLELIAEFADAERRGESLSSKLDAVREHLKQCPCCAHEYEALIEALEAAETVD